MPPLPPVYVPPLVAAGRRARRAAVKTAKASGDDRRGHSRARGYDRTWERLRRMHLAEHPLCAYCLKRGVSTLATVVDHIEPIEEAPERRLDPSNLQSLCKPHHDSTKQREDKRRRRARGMGHNGGPMLDE